MGGKKKELWQPSCWNLGEKFNSNFGNGLEEKKKKECWQLICGSGIAEMEGEKKNLWQWNCRNGRKNFFWGNWFVAMELLKWKEKKKICGNWFVAMLLPKWKEKRKEKRIVAMELPKIGGERKYLIGILVCRKKKFVAPKIGQQHCDNFFFLPFRQFHCHNFFSLQFSA